jgi:hypothetical protein
MQMRVWMLLGKHWLAEANRCIPRNNALQRN